MQDRYVGDIGDFGNIGLLRWLTGLTSPDTDRPLRLGIVQYTHKNEPSKGGHIGYLSYTPENSQRFQKCDPNLYSVLKGLVFRDNRTIQAAQQAFKQKGILPGNTLYYDKELTFGSATSITVKKEIRERWLRSAFDTTSHADIVFFNPDNGIANRESPTSNAGTKYAFINDLKRFAKNGNSLVIYHHLRGGDRDEKICRIAKEMRSNLKLSVWSLLYTAWTSRAYFIVPQPKDKPIIEARLCRLLLSNWCRGEKVLFGVSPA